MKHAGRFPRLLRAAQLAAQASSLMQAQGKRGDCPMVKRLLLLLPLLAFPLFSVAQSGASKTAVAELKEQSRTDFKTTIAPLFAKYCTNCHGGDSPKNDLSLEFADGRDIE